MLSGLFLTYKDSFIDFVTNALFLFECVVGFFLSIKYTYFEISVTRNMDPSLVLSSPAVKADGYLTLNVIAG